MFRQTNSCTCFRYLLVSWTLGVCGKRVWKMARYLLKRRRRWYAVLDIPEAVRIHFEGKARFFRSLETESLTEAERLVHLVVARWKAEIEAARSGRSEPITKLDQMALEWRRDFLNAEGQTREIYSEIIEDKAAELAFHDENRGETFLKLALGKSALTLEHLDSWLVSRSDTHKTLDMKRRDISTFAERFCYTHQIVRKDVQRWARDLQSEKKLHPDTVRRMISACRVYWRHLQDIDFVDDSIDPFSGVMPSKIAKTKASLEDKRKPFAPEELVSLLTEAASRSDYDLARLIWLGMWTGCRIEELCSLRASEVHGKWIVVDDAKTGAGIREVPIHSRLEELVISLVSASKDGYVLSGLTFNKYGDRSNAIGKRFGRLKTSIGFGPQYVFHSIRKTVATALQNADVPEPTSADILGHEKPTMTYGLYSGGANISVKKAAIEKLNYPLEGVPRYLFSK